MTSTDTSVALADATSSEASLRRFLHGLPGVDQVGAEQRAAGLATRSIKTSAKAYAVDLAVRMVDLTHARGCRHPRKVRPWPPRPSAPTLDRSCRPLLPPTAAVCVYPDMVATVREALGTPGQGGRGRHRLPSGRASRAVKLADTRDAVEAGADEIDMVIDRGAFLSGRYLAVHDEVVAVKEACARPGDPRGDAHLKVILETGELATYDNVRRRAGWPWPRADFIKTSTGKVQPAATLPVTMVMLEAVRDFRLATGRQVGVKPAGGIRTTKDALKHLVVVNEVAGPDWLDPDWFRFGASSLLDDLLMQRSKLTTGRYSGPDYVTVD